MEDGFEDVLFRETSLHDDKRTIMCADRIRDNKVKFIIYQGLDEAIFEIIASTMTSKEV
jgi:hypothetical protein